MKTYKFSNGDKVPLLGLGTWLSGKDEIYKAIRTAINLGYRHIDCAPIYGNEAEIGQAISNAIKENDVTREELWITTKLWNNSHKKESVIPTIEKSLKDLQIDYTDSYLLHWPIVQKDDVIFPNNSDDFISLEEIPISETWGKMEEIRNKGLAKHIGISNFSTKKISDIQSYCAIAPEVNQVEMHPYLQQKELIEYSKQNNILVTAYAPLGAGNQEFEGLNKGNNILLMQNDIIKNIASEKNCLPSQILLAWGITRGTSVIPKSTNPERLKQNLEAAQIELSQAQMETISNMDLKHRYYDGTGWTMPGSPYTLENLWDE